MTERAAIEPPFLLRCTLCVSSHALKKSFTTDGTKADFNAYSYTMIATLMLDWHEANMLEANCDAQ